MFDSNHFRVVRDIMAHLYPAQEFRDANAPNKEPSWDIHPVGEGQAVLAGGFLRDMLLGKLFKDVDVMSNVDPKGIVMEELHEPDPRYVHNDIDAVSNALVGGYTFNFIKTRRGTDTQDTIERIDFGICKVAWSKEDGLVISNEFLKDAQERTITNYRTGWGEAGVNAHYERLRGRFNWPLIQSKGYSQFDTVK